MYSIYVHILPDGKKYVGITSQDVEYRWQLGWGYVTNKPFFNAINSVGWSNIQHKVLETVEDKETALKREEYYTLLWRSNEPEFGYNIFVGNKDIRTDKPSWNKGKHTSPETKQKISEKVKEYYKNIGFSEEQIQKMRERKKKPFKIKNKKTGKIYKFDYQKDCAEFFGVSTSSVCDFLNGIRQSKFFSNYKILSK